MDMAFEIDVRDVVPAVRVPTLIVHNVDDPVCHVENARFLASEHPRREVRRAARQHPHPLGRGGHG